MSETRTVYTADDFEQLALVADTQVDAEAFRAAAARARVMEKLESWLPTLREQPHAPTVGQIEQQLDRLLREEGLR